MAAKKRTKAQIEASRAEIARLYLRGHTQQEIAVQLGMTRQMVGYDLKAIYDDWRASAVADLNDAKQRELARIDNLERVYWDEWEESRKAQETTSTKKVEAEKGRSKDVRREAMSRSEERLGDPRYLAGVQWCIEKRCAILGINAPTKIAPTSPNGEKEFSGVLTDDERIARLAELLNAARARGG